MTGTCPYLSGTAVVQLGVAVDVVVEATEVGIVVVTMI